jgi:hypothetical protein
MEPKKLQQAHVAAWNERDRAKRGLLNSIYADDITMYDTGFVLNGTAQISDFIQKLHGDPEFQFSSAGEIEPLQNSARLSGRIRTGKGALNSMDFFILDNGKVKQYYAFMSTE